MNVDHCGGEPERVCNYTVCIHLRLDNQHSMKLNGIQLIRGVGKKVANRYRGIWTMQYVLYVRTEIAVHSNKEGLSPIRRPISTFKCTLGSLSVARLHMYRSRPNYSATLI